MVKHCLEQRTDLDPARIVVGGAPPQPGRALHDAAEHDVAAVAAADCVLFLQSAGVLAEPRCLARLFAAVSRRGRCCHLWLSSTVARRDSPYKAERAAVEGGVNAPTTSCR